MPIYEFYCADCHMMFNFLSRKVDTFSRPKCPRCKKRKLDREISLFATVTRSGEKGEGEDGGDLPIDEHKMEAAMNALAGEAEHINENDPKQAAELMRKFSRMTGMKLGEGMEEALGRLEAGEDPESIEAEMGDLMDGEEPFEFEGGPSAAGEGRVDRRGAPRRDETLYEM